MADTKKDNAVQNNEPKEDRRHIGYANLIPLNELTEEEQREMQIKAGKASGVARRRKRDMREMARMMLNNAMNDDAVVESIGENVELLEDENGKVDKSAMAVLLAKMILEAQAGNVKAADFVRDTAGYKPKEQVEVDAVVTEADRALLDKVSKRLNNQRNADNGQE